MGTLRSRLSASLQWDTEIQIGGLSMSCFSLCSTLSPLVSEILVFIQVLIHCLVSWFCNQSVSPPFLGTEASSSLLKSAKHKGVSEVKLKISTLLLSSASSVSLMLKRWIERKADGRSGTCWDIHSSIFVTDPSSFYFKSTSSSIAPLDWFLNGNVYSLLITGLIADSFGSNLSNAHMLK